MKYAEFHSKNVRGTSRLTLVLLIMYILSSTCQHDSFQWQIPNKTEMQSPVVVLTVQLFD